MDVNDEFDLIIETDDSRKANLYRHALQFIEVYAIKYVEFQRVNCCRQEEVIALTLGQIPIQNSKVDPYELEFPFTVMGPKEFTTNDIPDLPVMFEVPIFQLGDGEFIQGKVILKKGIAADHVRWRAISTAAMRRENEKHILTIGTVGVLTPDEIKERIEEAIPRALAQEPVGKFFALSKPK